MKQLPEYLINRRKFIQYSSLAVGSGIVAACSNSNQPQTQSSPAAGASPAAGKLDKVVFGTNWVAEAEHGGFYQAIATGLYKEYGLDVSIRMGGPQLPSGTQLLMGNAVDLFMGYGIDAINAIAEGIPKVTVAAFFQKDPQCLIAHPNTGVNSLEDLKGRPIYVSPSANVTYWPFLKARYGFTDDQKRPYNFNTGPFLADKQVAQQGYVTAEPFAIEKQAGFKPLVFLLADYGYTPYAMTVEAKKEYVDKNPDVVQRFVEASIKGWYSYLDNPAPGNELIRKDNPEMQEDQIQFGIQKIKEYGLVESDAAAKQGIGAMTAQRWETLYKDLVESGITKPNINYEEAFMLDFVNKGVQAYQA